MILAIVQARMGSSRLPGKVLKEVMGKPLLGYMLERLSASRRIDRVLVATTTSPADGALCAWLQREKRAFFRGDENDVLDRFYRAASPLSPSVVVRLTADCPLIDPAVLDAVVAKREEGFDYVSNGAERPVYPDGLDAEAFTFRALATAWKEATLQSEREHVTPFIKKNPGRFRVGHLHPAVDFYGERWTVDNEEDFAVVKGVLEALYRPGGAFRMEDVLALKRARPEIFEANRAIGRNEGYAKSLANDRDLGKRGGKA